MWRAKRRGTACARFRTYRADNLRTPTQLFRQSDAPQRVKPPLKRCFVPEDPISALELHRHPQIAFDGQRDIGPGILRAALLDINHGKTQKCLRCPFVGFRPVHDIAKGRLCLVRLSRKQKGLTKENLKWWWIARLQTFHLLEGAKPFLGRSGEGKARAQNCPSLRIV